MVLSLKSKGKEVKGEGKIMIKKMVKKGKGDVRKKVEERGKD